VSEIKDIRKQDSVYYFGIAAGLIFIVAVIIYKGANMDQYLSDGLYDCYIRKTTGIICPGCGMTRAVRALFNLKLVKSSLYNLIPVYGLFCYLFLMIKETCHRLIGSRGVSERLFLNLVFIGIGLGIIQWIVKLILMYGFRIKML